MYPYATSKNPAWEVKARAHVCAESGEAFEEKESIMSRLIPGPGGMLRQDYRMSAWNPRKQQEALFYWKTQYRLPPPKKESPFKEENAEEMLRQLVEENDPATINTVFLLAVMLERKRLMLERGVQRDPDGRQIRIYEHRESGETFLIPDPELSLDQIDDVQQEVARKLGWIPPEDGLREDSPAQEDEKSGDSEEPQASEGESPQASEEESTEESPKAPDPESLQ